MRHNRQGRKNQDIRDELYHLDIYVSELAPHLGIAKATLYGWFDETLTGKRLSEVKNAIKAELARRGDDKW